MVSRATATAHTNIALIKYWGKRDERLVLPWTSSLSLTLNGLSTTTTVRFAPDADHGEGDHASLDEVPLTGTALQRVTRFLDLVRDLAGIDAPAEVTSQNHVPTAAGLASSSSGFAALAGAATAAAGLDLDARALSRLARRGSGSASRSIFGGLAVWHAGHDDESSFAEPIDSPLDLAILVITVSAAQKAISSRDAMRTTVATSPVFPQWVRDSHADFREALTALRAGDLERLGTIVEANSAGMHETMRTATPSVVYATGDSLRALQAVSEARAAGFPAWSTMDAGPNVKVLTTRDAAERTARHLRDRLGDLSVSVDWAGPAITIDKE